MRCDSTLAFPSISGIIIEGFLLIDQIFALTITTLIKFNYFKS